jgi:CubicO group peptidase (beta-lactamase class C family)
MKKRLFIFMVLLLMHVMLSAPSFAAADKGSEVIDTEKLDTVVLGQMDKHGLPEWHWRSSGWRSYLPKGYGKDGNGDLMTAQTKVYVGSQSKSFTALAIAQLAEQESST